MDFYQTICEEDGKEISLENLVIKAKKLNNNDAKIIVKGMIEVMAKLKYDNRISTKYITKGSGVKTIVYLKDKN